MPSCSARTIVVSRTSHHSAFRSFSRLSMHASGCRRTRKGLPELCVLNGTAVGGLDYELTVRKAAIRHQLTLINGVR